MEEESKRLEVISYDVGSVPKGMKLSEVMNHYKKTGILLYDKTRGEAPGYMFTEPKK